MKRKNYISKNSQILENNFLFFNKITLGENNMDKNLFVTKSYWKGNGKHQKEMDLLFDQLVPDYGNSDTLEGEILRAANRIYYDYYNNGMYNNTSGAVLFLHDYLYNRRGIYNFQPLKKIYDNCNTGFHVFENLEIPLENMMDKAIEYVISKNGQYEKNHYYKDLFKLQEKDYDKYKQRLVLERKRYRENNPPISKRHTLKGLNKLLSKDGCIIESSMLGYRNDFTLYTPDSNEPSGYKANKLYFKMINCRLDHLHKIYLDHGIEGLLKYDVKKIPWSLVSTITHVDNNFKIKKVIECYLLNQDMEVWFLLEKDKDRKSTYSFYLETQSGTKFISKLKIKSKESKRSIFLLTKGEQFLEKIIKLKTGEYEKWFLYMIDLKTKNIVNTYGIKDQSI